MKILVKSGFVIVATVVAAMVIVIVVSFTTLAKNDYNERALPVQAALAKVQLPAGYQVSNRYDADEPGPVGSTPVRVEVISVPSGRTHQQVQADFATVAPDSQKLVAGGDGMNFSFELGFGTGKTVRVTANPVTGGPDDPVKSITLTAR